MRLPGLSMGGRKMGAVRFGFIGLGGMAGVHWRNLSRFPDAELAAICDSDADRLSRFGESEGVPPDKRYRDFERLVNDPDVDAVVCITPNDAHAPVIRACLEAGKPFMAEKPFTRTFDEAIELMRMFAARPVVNMIGFSYRYHPQFRYAKRLIDSGALGRIRHAAIQYLQGWGSASAGHPMVWRFDRAVSGTGSLGDLGSHMIDMARYLIGEFQEVSGRLATFVHERHDPASGRMVVVEVDDYAAFHALIDPDIPVLFQTSRNAIGSVNQHEAFIYGDQGTLHVSSENRDTVTWIYHDKTQRKDHLELLAVPKDAGVDQWDEFMKVLQGEPCELLTTVRDGYINQAVMEAIVRSDRERRHVRLSEFPNPDNFGANSSK
jgi:predicted dehydrogenase